MSYEEYTIEGRNAVIEALRAGKPIDKLYILDGCQDGPVLTIKREAKKHNTFIKYVSKERLDQMSETGKHQGVIATIAAYNYSEVEDILRIARDKNEDPFIFILDGIEDPHNLGAIIRTANLCGAHGVIIPKNHAASLTATVARTSAGALNYTPVARVTNITRCIEELKKELEDLERIVNAFLELAEGRAKRQIPMTMEDWANRIDKYLLSDDRDILKDAGKISMEIAKDKAITEFGKYRVKQDKLYQSLHIFEATLFEFLNLLLKFYLPTEQHNK